eukprot:jgi/Hompol1/6447/HPOL_001712-RA
MDASLNLWENFVESIAQVLSQALTDKETEKLVSSFQALQQRLRQLSVENLRRLEQQAKEKAYSCKHHGTCVSNTLRAFIRSFVITYALKYALGFFPAVLTGKAFSSPRILIKIGGRDTISFSLFMSLFISSFKGMLCSLRAIRNVNDHWNSFIAGCFAGLSILLDTNKSRRIMIALYLSTRTTHFLSRWIWRTFVSKWFDRLGYHNPNAPHNHKHRHHKVDRHLQIDGAGSSNGVEDIRQIPDSADAIAIETAIDQQGRPVSTNATAATSNSPDKTRVSEILSVRGTTLAHPSPPRVHGADRNSHPTINIASSLTPPSFDISRTSPLPDRDLTEFEDVDDHRHTHHPMRKWIRQTSAVLVMMLSSSQILNAFVCEPDTLAKSYVSFLLTHGGIRDLQPTRAREYLNAFGSSINSTTVIPFSPAPEHPERLSFMERIPKGVPLEPLIKFQSFLDQHPQKYLLCSLQHPNYPHCYQSFLSASNVSILDTTSNHTDSLHVASDTISRSSSDATTTAAPASEPKCKPCCACPDTRKVRDECVIVNGEENCRDLIEAHQACMRSMGFNI